MSGDDLTIGLFLFGTAIAFGLTAVTLELAGQIGCWLCRFLVSQRFYLSAQFFGQLLVKIWSD